MTTIVATSEQHPRSREASSSHAFHQSMKNSAKEPPKRPFMKKLSRTGPLVPQANSLAPPGAAFPLAPPAGCFMMPPLFAAGPMLSLPPPQQGQGAPTNPKDIIRQPNDWDVCLGDIEHPGTRAWRDVVVQAASQEPLPTEGCNVADILFQLRQKKGVNGRFLVKLKGMEGFRMATPWEVDWWTQQGFWHVVQRRQELGASNVSTMNLQMQDFSEEQLMKRAQAVAHLAAAAGVPKNLVARAHSPNQNSGSNNNAASSNSTNNNSASASGNTASTSNTGAGDAKNLSLQQVFQDATSQLQRDEWLANQSTSSHIIQKGLKAHKALYYLQPFSTVATLVWSDIFKKRYEDNAPGSKGGSSLEDRLDRARRVKEIKKLEQAEQLCIQFVQGMMRVFLEEDEDELVNEESESGTEQRKRPREEAPAVGSNAMHSSSTPNRARSQPSVAVDDDSDIANEMSNSKRRMLTHEAKTTSSQSSTSTSPNVILPDRPVVIPKARDVCFAMINHPGTKAWRETVDSLSGRADLDWSINIHHLVKAQMEMEGRSFYVCLKQEQHRNKELRNAQWCLATDDEVMQKTRQRFRDFRKPPRTERIPAKGGRNPRGSSLDDNGDDDDEEDEEDLAEVGSPVSRALSPSHLPSPSILAATMDNVVSTVNDNNGKDPLARLASAAAFAPLAKVKAGEKADASTPPNSSNKPKLPKSISKPSPLPQEVSE